MKLREQSSTSYPIMLFMADVLDHVSGKTGLAPTVTLSKNGAAFGAAAGAVSEVANGWYALAGNATDRDTVGELVVHATATGADPTDDRLVIVPWDPFDAANLGLTNLDAAVTTRVASADYTAARAAKLDNVDAAVSTRLASTDITLTGGKVTPINVDGMTFESAMELILAVLAGVASPSGSTVQFKKRDGATSKITITYGDVDGQRTGSVIDA